MSRSALEEFRIDLEILLEASYPICRIAELIAQQKSRRPPTNWPTPADCKVAESDDELTESSTEWSQLLRAAKYHLRRWWLMFNSLQNGIKRLDDTHFDLEQRAAILLHLNVAASLIADTQPRKKGEGPRYDALVFPFGGLDREAWSTELKGLEPHYGRAIALLGALPIEEAKPEGKQKAGSKPTPTRRRRDGGTNKLLLFASLTTHHEYDLELPKRVRKFTAIEQKGLSRKLDIPESTVSTTFKEWFKPDGGYAAACERERIGFALARIAGDSPSYHQALDERD